MKIHFFRVDSGTISPYRTKNPLYLLQYFNNFAHLCFQPFRFQICFFSFYTQQKKQKCGTKIFWEIFFFQSISKYFNSFEHPHFQPQCVRISFLGFSALNKKQIWGTKFLRSIFRAILLKYLIILSNHNFSRTANGYVFPAWYAKWETNLWNKNF